MNHLSFGCLKVDLGSEASVYIVSSRNRATDRCSITNSNNFYRAGLALFTVVSDKNKAAVISIQHSGRIFLLMFFFWQLCKFVCVSRIVGTATVLFLTVTTVGDTSMTALANMLDVDIESSTVSIDNLEEI